MMLIEKNGNKYRIEIDYKKDFLVVTVGIPKPNSYGGKLIFLRYYPHETTQELNVSNLIDTVITEWENNNE